MSSSRKARHRLTRSSEGNTVVKGVERLGDVGRLVEMGTSIRVTRGVVAKNTVIQPCDCGIQYNGCLKTERYGVVQVVLLIPLILTLPRACFRKNSKSMEVGILQRVVVYFVVQKTAKHW